MWGGGIRQERVKSQALFNSGKTLDETQFRAFSNLEWRASDSMIWNLGGMLEHNNFIGTQLSPRLALNVHLNPLHTLRGSITQAYRTPSMLEVLQDSQFRHSDGTLLDWVSRGDANLDPERIQSFELGYLGKLPRLKLDLDLKLFREEVDNAIGPFTEPLDCIDNTTTVDPCELFDNEDVRTNKNTTFWTTEGFEAQLKFRPSSRTWFSLQYGFAQVEGQEDRGPKGGRDLTLATPRHTLSLVASHRFSGDLEASLAFYRETATQWLDGTSVENYNRLDARLAKKFQLGASDGQVALIVHNLLKPYVEFQDNNLFDTRGYLDISLNF